MIDVRTVIALLELPGMGRRTVWQVITRCRALPTQPDELLDTINVTRREWGRFPMPTREALDEAGVRASEILRRADQLGLRTIAYGDPCYPARLAAIPDPPVALYAKGNADALKEGISVAVIGTREPSPWGEATGERLARRLAERGIIVVSGLALGCDTAAHRGCLKGRGRTVAILAHGLHTVYPAKNRALADQILTSGGCLVSEYAPDVRANRNFFVERDRLQSGMSAGVIVVETDVEGGTMHTVKACLAQRRVLGCLSHPKRFANPKSRGNQLLIDRGEARPIAGPDDLGEFIQRLQVNNTEPGAAGAPGLFGESGG